jgi:D-alanine--poly(phosphoribitol) ligase subunit 1
MSKAATIEQSFRPSSYAGDGDLAVISARRAPATNFNPASPFFRNSLKQPERLAIVGDGRALSYREAAGYARAIAARLNVGDCRGARVAILGSRSVAACLAVLGTCWAGATYTPLGLKLPEERLAALLGSSGFDALICDRQGEALLTDAVLAAAPEFVLLADAGAQRDWPGRRIWRLSEAMPGEDAPVAMTANDLAYIEFTSGTTGVPKGVMISAGGLDHYVKTMQDWYLLNADDRVAETSDLSFDISVSNMFLTWNVGAALYIATTTEAMAPVKFIRENELSMWYSVPSVIALAQRTRTLRPGGMPSLRRSVFAGEPLPADGAQAWLEAAPNSKVDNLYGPTEATVVCMRQEVTMPPRITAERGIVAIGAAFPGMKTAILDSERRFLGRGERGEIALSGPQLAAGYLHQPGLTADRFPLIDGERWYLTGDIGYEDDEGTFHHLGRIDNQVKVRGYRVELEEIDVHLRRAGQTTSAAAVAWPTDHGSAAGIVAFVANAGVPVADIKDAMRKALPAYMVPNSIVELESLPLNANGKTDRRALTNLLDEGRS